MEKCFMHSTGSCVTGHCQELNTPGSLPPRSDSTALMSCPLVPQSRGCGHTEGHLPLSLKQFALGQIKIPEGPRDSSQTHQPCGRLGKLFWPRGHWKAEQFLLRH